MGRMPDVATLAERPELLAPALGLGGVGPEFMQHDPRWRRWTGLPFDRDGLVAVDGGLAPAMVFQSLDLGVYVEPNVWFRHDTARVVTRPAQPA